MCARCGNYYQKKSLEMARSFSRGRRPLHNLRSQFIKLLCHACVYGFADGLFVWFFELLILS